METISTKVKSVLNKHDFQKKALIPILQEIQAEYNYLPELALRIVAHSLEVPLIDVIGVATFYRAFSLKPRGKHMVTVCLGTACHVRGGPKVLAEFQKKLNLQPGETSADGLFTLETVACLGCCAIGPVVVVDGNYHAQTTARKVEAILKKHLKKEKTHGRSKKNRLDA
ncbi:MAG: NADH-quinone oxidoreductase subunit NuoE [Candidatus Aminicenantales bacterium]